MRERQGHRTQTEMPPDPLKVMCRATRYDFQRRFQQATSFLIGYEKLQRQI